MKGARLVFLLAAFACAAAPSAWSDEFTETPVSFVRELWLFMRVRKKFWLLPVIVMTAAFGGLIVLSKGSAIAPFLYTLF